MLGALEPPFFFPHFQDCCLSIVFSFPTAIILMLRGCWRTRLGFDPCPGPTKCDIGIFHSNLDVLRLVHPGMEFPLVRTALVSIRIPCRLLFLLMVQPLPKATTSPTMPIPGQDTPKMHYHPTTAGCMHATAIVPLHSLLLSRFLLAQGA